LLKLRGKRFCPEKKRTGEHAPTAKTGRLLDQLKLFMEKGGQTVLFKATPLRKKKGFVGYERGKSRCTGKVRAA